MIAVRYRLGLQGSQVRTGAGFGIALAPEFLAREDLRQVAFFLCVRPKGIDDGTDHCEAKGAQRGGMATCQFLSEYVAPHRIPFAAAVLFWPIRRGPALLE